MNNNSIDYLKAANDEFFIKHCPFCGYDGLFVDKIDYSGNQDIPEEYIKKSGEASHAVVCYECNARGSEKETSEQAIEAWNKRSEV